MSFPDRAPFTQITEVRRNTHHVFHIRITNHRNQQTIRRIRGKADMKIFLVNQAVAVCRHGGIEYRELLERDHAGFNIESQRRQSDIVRGCGFFQFFAALLEFRDIRFIILRDVRQIDPACVQPRTRYLLNTAQRPDLNLAEFREIDLRYAGPGGARAHIGLSGQYRFDESPSHRLSGLCPSGPFP